MIELGCNYSQELIDLIEREEIEDGLKEIAILLIIILIIRGGIYSARDNR